MRLYMTAGSPYARIVRVQAHELGLTDRIEEVPATLRDPNSVVLAVSPLGRVPVLVTDDGIAISDTKAIAEYLDRLHVGPRFLPNGGTNLWHERAFEALAMGILDGAIAYGRELGRPVDKRSAAIFDGEVARAKRCLDHLETTADTIATSATFGPVTLACAIAYLDRLDTGSDWRDGRPALARWHAAMLARPSFVATAPPAKK
ncbi:glutathione S-transferase [Stella humosa]|uniref:Glutathione S-transferase n=1 Tax=Stella humosa TaxID=94 RepID=A0A3N1MFV7_9PROT|nr:glutathione S-transferase N-terminal domain-containing protein [Stella humosa]ROQ00076.1 glutathione S-transferase [Stella humosa]BBK30689.1 glutathione S-transferase [Stella humosa]